jgi:signal transduction histidine kinase
VIADRWRRADVVVRDLPLALLLVVTSFLPLFEGHETQVGDLPARPFDAVAAVVLALEALPLAVRRRAPAWSLGLVSLGFLVGELLSYHLVAATALPIAVMSAGAHLDHHRRVAAITLSAGYGALAVTLHLLGAPETVGGFVVFYVGLVVAWGAGSWLRSTRAAEAERRRRVAEATRAAERTRIARELHDVVTHHVTAMVVQAEAARYLAGAPERLDESLAAVADTGRRAVGDLRHLLDVLDPGHESGAGVPSGGVLPLVEQVRRAGQPVELTEEGRPVDVDGTAALTAHRVVQESLTNALKHARGSRTVVHVRYSERGIAVEVGTDGSGLAAGVGGSGRGLAGLRDRVCALGGEFSADRRSGGGFVVRARIPTGEPV